MTWSMHGIGPRMVRLVALAITCFGSRDSRPLVSRPMATQRPGLGAAAFPAASKAHAPPTMTTEVASDFQPRRDPEVLVVMQRSSAGRLSIHRYRPQARAYAFRRPLNSAPSSPTERAGFPWRWKAARLPMYRSYPRPSWSAWQLQGVPTWRAHRPLQSRPVRRSWC